MKIEKWVLCIVLILTIQVSYKVIPVLSEQDSGIQKVEDADMKDIKNVIETYYNNFGKKDLNSMINQLSKDFSSKIKGKEVGSEEYKNIMKTNMEIFYKKYKDFSLISINILNSDVFESKGILNTEVVYKSYNLSSLQYDIIKKNRAFSLKKENSLWKIYRIYIE